MVCFLGRRFIVFIVFLLSITETRYVCHAPVETCSEKKNFSPKATSDK